MDFPGKSTFFESPNTHKRFIFEHSYILYGKRQKSCTSIVVLVILSYLTFPILNSSSKSTGFFFANEEVLTYYYIKYSVHFAVNIVSFFSLFRRKLKEKERGRSGTMPQNFASHCWGLMLLIWFVLRVILIQLEFQELLFFLSVTTT